MSVGFRLRGRQVKKGLLGMFKGKSSISEDIAKYLKENARPELPSYLRFMSAEAMEFELCPFDEPLRFKMDGDEFFVDGHTSAGGAGYHKYVCDLLKGMPGKVAIEWLPTDGEDSGDETGYWESGDPKDIEEVMHGWLDGLVGVMKENSDKGADNLMINMAIGGPYTVVNRGITTPQGTRTFEDLAAITPDDAYLMWPWPLPESHFLAGYARYLMANEVIWDKPLDEEETRTLKFVNSLLEKAEKSNPNLELPYREWAELRELLGLPKDSQLQVKAELSSGPLIGYRRGFLRHSVLDGIELEMPGHFRAAWDDQSFRMWDARHTVHMSIFSVPNQPEDIQQEVPAWVVMPEHLKSALVQHLQSEVGEAETFHIFKIYKNRMVILISMISEIGDETEWFNSVFSGLEIGEESVS